MSELLQGATGRRAMTALSALTMALGLASVQDGLADTRAAPAAVGRHDAGSG
jgi:hypothetical protein